MWPPYSLRFPEPKPFTETSSESLKILIEDPRFQADPNWNGMFGTQYLMEAVKSPFRALRELLHR